MELVMVFDMRAPQFGAPREVLFDAALAIGEWADQAGFNVIGLGEHHSSEDGYNPSPLVLAAALAGRTRKIRLRTAVLLASCYDPVRLAEDTAVLQILSHGRFELGLGFGYRQCEFAMYGRDVKDRFNHTLAVLDTLRKAWTGQPFDYDGRPCLVSPVPRQPIPVLLGGAAKPVARAAARHADGFLVPMMGADVWQPYREECLQIGKPDPGEYPKQGPTFLWISEDPDRDWDWLTPHILHVLESYSRWINESYGKEQKVGVYNYGVTAESIRKSGTYQVLTPEQAVDLVRDLGDHSSLYLTPLLGGIDPARAWKMLHLFEEKVLPHIPRDSRPRWGVPETVG